MNILIVTAMFPPIQTGTSFYSRNLADAFSRGGHNVTVVALNNRESSGEEYNFRLIRLPAIKIPLKNYFKHFRISSVYPRNYQRLRKIAAVQQTDVILLVNHYQEIAFPAIYAARKNRIPLVVSVGTQLYSMNPRRDRILNILDRTICGRLIFPKCERIISWDNQIYKYLENVHNEAVLKKTSMVRYGINGDESSLLGHKHDYGLNNQIIGVGAVIGRRNFSFMVRIFNELKDEFPELKLIIIGHIYNDEPVRLAKELGLNGRVVFTGEQPHDFVMQELKKSCLYWNIITGKYTGLGTATIETMMMGIPIISNAPANLFGDDLLKDMDNMVYSDGSSLEKTVDKFRKLLSHKSLREKIGGGGREFASVYMTWNAVVNDYEKVFKEIINPEKKNGKK